MIRLWQDFRCWMGWHAPMTIVGRSFVWDACRWCNKVIGPTKMRRRR